MYLIFSEIVVDDKSKEKASSDSDWETDDEENDSDTPSTSLDDVLDKKASKYKMNAANVKSMLLVSS